jgi:CRISPR-associated endonuclease/helicase Cas3
MPPQLEEYFDYLQVIDHTKQFTDAPHRSLTWRSDIDIYKEENDEKDFADFQNQVTQIVLQEWGTKPNRRILVVVETVRDAAATYLKLKEHFGGNADQSERFLFLYHGRIADQLRPDIYKDIK